MGDNGMVNSHRGAPDTGEEEGLSLTLSGELGAWTPHF